MLQCINCVTKLMVYPSYANVNNLILVQTFSQETKECHLFCNPLTRKESLDSKIFNYKSKPSVEVKYLDEIHTS